jgi:transaldolase
MTYNIIQLQIAINFDADYCITLHHKNKENEDFVWDAVQFKEKTKSDIKLIGASYRTKEEVIDTIMSGIDYATVPPKVLEECFISESAQEEFDKIYS